MQRLLLTLFCTFLAFSHASASRADVGQIIVAAARRQIGTSYTQQYFSLKYPNGDPPKNVGACTDVIIRALRPAGYDLQKLIHQDMKRNFALYPRKWGLRRPDRNIDHRRVPNQRRYFERFAQRGTLKADKASWSQWRAGDIVQWKLANNLDHTGIVSNHRAANGRPLVIHNLGGCREEDALTTWKIVAHFRFPPR
ncbi:MAG TPA: DUF1287 domain-containing protein [Abditibacteriaceae bacterium]|jgi:hypothetical protein